MAKKALKIQKIPLDSLIETLVNLYNSGVDYVDISGVHDKDYDTIALSFTSDYMTEEGKKNFGVMETEMEISNSKLTDDDLNQLI